MRNSTWASKSHIATYLTPIDPVGGKIVEVFFAQVDGKLPKEHRPDQLSGRKVEFWIIYREVNTTFDTRVSQVNDK